MTRRIVIIQGDPDPTGQHLLHAMADAYAKGATAAGANIAYSLPAVSVETEIVDNKFGHWPHFWRLSGNLRRPL